MDEIELFCCGVKVKVFKHIIDEFNEYRLLLVQIQDGDIVPPVILTTLNHFCSAKHETNQIIQRMMEAA